MASLSLSDYAVEPNDAMREEGMKIFNWEKSFSWFKGTVEVTELPDNCVNLVLMGSFFIGRTRSRLPKNLKQDKNIIKDVNEIKDPYRSHAWTVKSRK